MLLLSAIFFYFFLFFFLWGGGGFKIWKLTVFLSIILNLTRILPQQASKTNDSCLYFSLKSSAQSLLLLHLALRPLRSSPAYRRNLLSSDELHFPVLCNSFPPLWCLKPALSNAPAAATDQGGGCEGGVTEWITKYDSR